MFCSQITLTHPHRFSVILDRLNWLDHTSFDLFFSRYVKMLEKWLEGVRSSDEELDEESENLVVKKVFLNKLQIEEGIKFAQQDKSVEITIPREVR